MPLNRNSRIRPLAFSFERRCQKLTVAGALYQGTHRCAVHRGLDEVALPMPRVDARGRRMVDCRCRAGLGEADFAAHRTVVKAQLPEAAVRARFITRQMASSSEQSGRLADWQQTVALPPSFNAVRRAGTPAPRRRGSRAATRAERERSRVVRTARRSPARRDRS